MNFQEYLLNHATQECVEVAHRLTKAAAFGMHEKQPNQPFTNYERIYQEFMDLIAIMDRLGIIDVVEDPDDPHYAVVPVNIEMIRAKLIKMTHYQNYARECGTLV